jgi:hypothetical protein
MLMKMIAFVQWQSIFFEAWQSYGHQKNVKLTVKMSRV